MASPLAKGLFARAIGESGAFFSTTLQTPTRSATEATGVRFAESVGAKSLAELRALSATELLEAASRPGVPRFETNVDGYFFPETPAQIFAAGEQAKVPLLAGWNSEESNGRSLLPGEPTPDSVRAVYERLFGTRAAEAEEHFPRPRRRRSRSPNSPGTASRASRRGSGWRSMAARAGSPCTDTSTRARVRRRSKRASRRTSPAV
jgi:para-nitrobenzyl esterase